MLVELTRPDGSSIWVNLNAVTSFAASEEGDPGNTTLRFAQGIQLVMETPE